MRGDFVSIIGTSRTVAWNALEGVSKWKKPEKGFVRGPPVYPLPSHA